MGKKKKSKQYYLGLMLDVEKAYDILEWDFIDLTLSKFNFPPIMKNWLMKCITSASFQVKVNGNTSTPWKASRGIRQGDTLSPYIFILC